MALKIIAVHLVAGAPALGWKHHHIHSVRCAGPNNTTGTTRFRVDIALDIHESKASYYTMDAGGVRCDVEVFETDGIKYIRSKAIGTRPDPLLLLPTY